MNCGEAVKPGQYAVEAPRKPVLNKKFGAVLIWEILFYPRESVQIRGKGLQNKCGTGQPPVPHRSRISRLAFPPLGAAGRRYWSESAHEECHIYQYSLQRCDREITALQPLRRPAAQPAQRASCKGGRNARATGTRSRAFPIPPGNSPSRIASCHQRHRKSSFGKLWDCHVFAEPTLRQNVATRNRKTFPRCAEPVDDETCLWKP